jgi:perosamine synthetase
MIAISMIPNFEVDDIRRGWQMIVSPEIGNGYGNKLRQALKTYFKKDVVLTESGRLGLWLLFKAYGIGKDDEVMVQALTCSVVPGSILGVGATPIYVDVDGELNMDIADLKKKTTKKSKVVIIQNTFGKPAKIKEIVDWAHKNKMIVIEDLAHGFGNSYEGKPLGCWGEAAFLSFGRDKVISGVWGGAVVGPRETMLKVEDQMSQWKVRDNKWIRKQLWYPILINIIIKTYEWTSLGKGLHKLARHLGILSEVISQKEKGGGMGDKHRGLPDQLAYLIWGQWQKIDKLIEHRRELAAFYASSLGEKFDETSSYLRFPMVVDDPMGLRLDAAKNNIYLGDWYDQVVAPKSVNMANFGYKMGSCPKAEKMAKKIINLPTNPNMSTAQAARVVAVIKKWKS